MRLILFTILLAACAYSCFDLYNNFAYEKAILRDSPYGVTPLIADPLSRSSYNGVVKSGDYVYVQDWLSAYDGRIVFAKIKSKFREGYVNKEFLVRTNMNPIPILSALILLIVIFYFSVKFIRKILTYQIVHS